MIHHLKAEFQATTRNLSVATKLSAAAGLAVLLCFSLVGALLSWRTQAVLTTETLETLADHASMSVDMLSTFNRQLDNEVQVIGASLEGYFSGEFVLDETHPVAVANTQVPGLLVGGRPILPGSPGLERFSQLTKALATIFVRRGDDLVRIATTVTNDSGQRPIGVALDRANPAHAALLSGRDYSGKVILFGRQVYAHYKPIRDVSGSVVGAFFVGLDFTDALAGLKTRVKAITVGTTGYIYAIDATPGPSAGTLAIHPKQEGQNILAAKDGDGREYIKEMLEKKHGVIHYPWLDIEAHDSTARMRVEAYVQFKEWNWVVAVGSYSEEFAGPARQVRNLIVVSSLCAALVLSWLLITLSRRMVRQPVERAVEVAQAIARGDLDGDIVVESKDEMGRLLAAMASMRERLRDFVDAQEQLARLHNVEGKVSARLGQAQFPGAYGLIAGGVNKLLDHHRK